MYALGHKLRSYFFSRVAVSIRVSRQAAYVCDNACAEPAFGFATSQVVHGAVRCVEVTRARSDASTARMAAVYRRGEPLRSAQLQPPPSGARQGGGCPRVGRRGAPIHPTPSGPPLDPLWTPSGPPHRGRR
eukprot:941023-Pyramimonas_sp.AAC.1